MAGLKPLAPRGVPTARRMWLIGSSWLLLAASASWAGAVSRPHVKVDLLADHAAVAAGGRVMLAVAFELDPEWHIYWKNHGATGLPTTVKFTLPAGWSVGPLLFPAPTGHTDEFGDQSYILEGRPAILAELSAPSDATAGTTAEIQATVSWLVCKKECIKGQATLSLALPIVAGGGSPAAANEAVFKKARRALPVPADQAKYITVRGEAGRPTIAAGDKFEARVIIDVKQGHHIQSAKPLTEGLVATQLFFDSPPGISLESAKFPAGHERTVPSLGKVSEYHGTVSVAVPIEITDELKPGPGHAIEGVLRYQACNEAGTCYPPESVAFEIRFGGDGKAAAGAEDEGEKSAWATPLGPGDGESTDRAMRAIAPVGREPSASPSASAGLAESTPYSAPYSGTIIDRWTQRLGERGGRFGVLVLALIGGFILNFMPCVLPVISIKVLSFVRQAHEDRWRILALGLAFSAGILASFLVLGVLIIQFESQWGGLFQRPRVVIGMAAVVTAFALSLFGVFSLNPPRVVNELGEKVQGEGLASAFGTGLLATALGTACTAPFLSAVVAIAVKQPPPWNLVIFLAAGVGMALPYVLLTAQPAWVRVVPRPGPWMDTFERIVGFLLLATVVWLLAPLPKQIGPTGVLWTLVFLIFVSIAAWVYGRIGYDAPAARRVRGWATVLVLLAAGWWTSFRWHAPIDQLVEAQIAARKHLALLEQKASGAHVSVDWKPGAEIPWRTYSHRLVGDAVAAGHTVFVDYTADWCVNCKANERLILNTLNVKDEMRRLGVVPFQADYTSEDPEIKADLAKYGRSGVPMYLVIPAGRPDKAIVLPEVLTSGLVIDALRSAGPSTAVRLSAKE